MKNNTLQIVFAILAGFGGAWIFNAINENDQKIEVSSNAENPSAISVKGNDNRSSVVISEGDFVEASKTSTQSVVYIKNISSASYQMTWMDMFFNNTPNREVQVSSGSGVIVSTDGYIVTNSHVINGAERIEVIYNKRTLNAELVGVDPASDLAVLKVEESNMPAIPIGSSKALRVGEWVIAVGNPFNLNSTVTAGIVSAKGRQINILKDKFPLESFIQTDAAINPGNSGGALVNRDGKLVGINTAILSRTGSYVGYGFAVPVDVVMKIFNDIVKFGEVQKAFFGGDVEDYTLEIAERFDIDEQGEFDGALLVYLKDDGAAAEAGMKEGDVIVEIDRFPVKGRAEFEEELSLKSPGDQIMVKYKRDNKEYNTKLTLTNREGTTEILKREIVSSEYLNADFEVVPKVERDVLGIEYGVKIFNIKRGRLTGMEEKFIITHINNVPVKSAEKLIDMLENVNGVVWIEGVDENGRKARYRFYGN